MYLKNIIQWSFRNRAAMIVVVLLVLVLGTISYFTLPMEFLPEADNPQVVVATLGQGHDAASMKQGVTGPVEEAVSTIKGKSDVLSETGDGYSQVILNFDADTDMKEATQEVKEALSSVTFPEGVTEPNVVQLNTSMIPVSEVTFSFADGLTDKNMETVEKEILPLFQSVTGVANVSLYGKAEQRIVIQPDKKKLEKYHLPLDSLLGMLEGQNFAVSAGEKVIDGKRSNIKVSGNLDDLDTLRNMVIPNPVPEAPPLRLKDVASVKLTADQESMTRINGDETLALSVTKDSTSSAVDVAKEVEKTVKAVNTDYKGIKAKVAYSTSDMIESSVNSMMQEVLLGALFATIVIMLFLRNIRATMITIVSIPLSLGMTLLLLWASGVTLNILTLGGIAVSIGRLVDDSIVVVENIFRRMQVGRLTKQTIVDATAEVGKAITSSTLVTVAVFLPMGLIDGSLRNFILPFALTVTYSLLTSLVVAVTVVPLMSSRLFRSSREKEHKKPDRYLRLLNWSLNHKFVPILVAIVIFVGSIVLYTVMPKGAISAEDASMVTVTMDYPSDTPVTKVKEKAQDLEKKILKLKGYTDVMMMVGSSSDQAKWGEVRSSTQATFTIFMKEGADAEKFIDELEKEKDHYPDAELSVAAASMMSSGTSAITYDVIGDDEEKLEEVSQKVIAAVKDVDGVEKVSSNQEEKKPVYSVVVDTSKGNTQQTAMQLRMLLNETPMGTVRIDDRDTSVYLDAKVDPSSKKDLDKLKLSTPEGKAVSLSSLASIEKNELSSTLLHKNGNPYIRVSAEVDPEKLSVVSQQMGMKINEIQLPKDVKVEVGGASDQQANEFADLGLTMLASIGIVYLIMVITFKSLRAPIAILMSIPLAAIGSILGLMITQVPVDPTALIGGLMLIGVVVTNAVVLIDRVKQNEETMTIREAIVEASGTRLRPILMTAIATICAMLPLLFGNSEDGSLVSQGLAVVVIGGLTVSTVLTLVIVPVFYELLHFRQSKIQRIDRQEGKQTTV